MKKVLVVDDSKLETIVLSKILEKDYEVITASNGRDAVHLMYKEYKNLAAVLLDIEMPVMNGYQVLKLRRDNPFLSSILTIVVTGNDDISTKKRAKAMGATAFIAKPYVPKEILDVLKDSIAQSRQGNAKKIDIFDSLTGVLGRGAFFASARDMIKDKEAGFYYLTALNIEGFKLINDQYGTAVGDQVLKHVARNLDESFRKMNGLCGRITADNFVILVPYAKATTKVFKEIYDKIISPDCIDVKLKIRIGRYIVADKSLSVNAMYDRAKMAADSIRGNYEKYAEVYNDELRFNLVYNQEIFSNMEDALKSEQFKVWVQPQYNHATGAMIGGEALVRWDTGHAIIPPNEFIPLFEQNGFIYQMDKYIWEQVCKTLRGWLDKGLKPLPISINISRRDIIHDDCVSVLTNLTKKYDIGYNLLRLEVTESSFSGEDKLVIEKVKELISLGYTVEIDDFGSGYSSLNTLKDVPASIIKLDMRFFENTEDTERAGNIIESVVRMARWLGMAVIAEGVEEKEQADFLKSIGCYYIQGYYYAKPMPINEYEKLMAVAGKEPQLTRLKTIETLDNSKFWDPKSMDTLIFNSYVGGACIFEWCNGKAELLRVNDRYIAEMGSLIEEGATLRESSMTRFLDDANNKIIRDTLARAMKTKTEESCEVVLSSGEKTEYVCMTCRLVATADKRYLFYNVITNVTRQKVAEMKELESAEKLQVIMNNVNGGVSALCIDEDGHSQMAFNNEKYYELYGYTRAEAEADNLDVMTMILPEDIDGVMKKVAQLKKDGKPRLIDYGIMKRDGSKALLRANASLMSIAGFGDEVITSVITDITEKRSLEGQLTAIVGNINGGVTATVIKNGVPEFVVVNDQFFQILGYKTREEYEADNPDKYTRIHPEDRDRIVKQFESSDGGKKQYTMEYRVIRKDGTIRYLINNISVINLFGIDGPVQLSVVNDVTEQKVAEIKERELMNQLQLIMTNISGGITATTFKGKDEMEILFSNDGYYEMYGYTKEQAEKEVPDMLQLIVPEDREKTLETVARIIESGVTETYDYRCYKRDGSIVWVQCTNSVLSTDGGRKILLALTTDVTMAHEVQKREQENAAKLQTIMDTADNGITAVALREDKTEFLFANDKYFEIHGIKKDFSVFNEVGDSLALVHPDDREYMKNVVIHAVTPGSETHAEYRIIRPNGDVAWIRSTISVVNFESVNTPVQVSVFTDVTEDRETTEQFKFLNDTAGDILQVNDSNKGINMILHKIMEYFQGDRAYVVEIDYNKAVTNNTYECCAAGINPEIDNLQALPFDGKEVWYEELNNGEFFIVRDVEELKETNREFYSLLKEQEIESVVLAPIISEGKLIGFSGVDNPRMHVSRIARLSSLADYITLLIVRRDLNNAIDKKNNELKQLVNDTPGGFLRMEIFPDKNPIITGFNQGLCQMLDMTREEIFQKYGDDAYNLLVAEDIAATSVESAEALKDVSQFTSRCRLRRGDGQLIWVRVFGRFIKSEDGRLHLNSYFADITAEKKKEDLEVELLDNMPVGSALYEFDGENLKVIHINKTYWEMVEREPVDYANASVVAAIHPDDREMTIREVRSAIRMDRNAVVTVRIACGQSKYKPFRVTAKIVAKDVGVHLVYASYEKITEKEMSIQDTLKIGLTTLMSTTGELSYIKDKDMRYISCSKSFKRLFGITSQDEIIGKTAYECFDAKYAQKFDEDDRQVATTGKPVEGMLESVITLDGKVNLVSTSKYPILDVNGDVAGIYSVSRDVTSQKEKDIQLELLQDNLAGGLAAYKISASGIETIFFNDGYYNYSGYSKEEYLALIKDEPLALMFEEDRPKFLEKLRKLIKGNKDKDNMECTYRCLTKKGEVKWMEFKGLLSVIDERVSALNVIQIDVTREKEEIDMQIALLDNIPCGAALYKFDGKTLESIHLNKEYERITNRKTNSGNSKQGPMDYIHPMDRKIVLNELSTAVKEGRDGICDIRLLYGEEEYRYFHLVARINQVGKSVYMVNVTYSYVTNEEIKNNKLIPYIFRTVMEASNDLAFAKDRDFKYICCSKLFAKLVGYEDQSDVVGKTDKELFPEKIALQFYNDDKELMESAEPRIDVVESIPSADGSNHYTRTSKYLLKNLKGEVLGVYGIGRDITDTREAYSQLKVLTDSIPGGIITFSYSQGTVFPTYFNDGLCELSGYSREEYEELRIPPLDFVYKEDLEILRNQLGEMIESDKPIDCVVRIHAKGGISKWISVKAVVYDRIGEITTINSVIMDITEQQVEKERLRISEEFNRLALNHSGNVIARYDVEKKKLTMPKHYEGIFDLSETIVDVPEKQIADDDISPATAQDFRRLFDSIGNGHQSGSGFFELTSNHGWRWIEARYTTLFSQDGDPTDAIFTFSDVTENKKNKQLAETDPLTGLLNRKAFKQQSDRCLRQKETCAILMIDIDDFKQINDTHGHQEGDKALLKLAEKLKQVVRKEDLVCRLGGDEFILMLRNVTSIKATAAKAEKICAEIKEESAENVKFSVSIGISMSPEDGTEYMGLYVNADRALYEVKQKAKGSYAFYSGGGEL